MRIVLIAALVAFGIDGAGTAERAAKQLFGAVSAPADMPARSIGSYAKGCLAGAVALPLDGPNWQVMRLSRNRNWGNPVLIDYIRKFSRDAATDGWPGLLVGDMAQPRGGPMLTGHASHQIGLDADIWLTPMPDYTMSRAEREDRSAVSMLVSGKLQVDERVWSGRPVLAVLRRAASYPEVARIFVSAAIKKKLCETAGTDRAWLRKIRPWWGHDAHFHVRLECPAGLAECTPQAPVGPGDGCNELAEWFKPPPPPPPKPVKPPPPPRELTLADLPDACAAVLGAGMPQGAVGALGVPMPNLRPRPN